MVLEDANIITSDFEYKLKANVDGCRRRVVRIVVHGSKDAEQRNLLTDISVFQPIGIRILLSLAVMKWCMSKIDFNSVFLWTGDALKDVHVVSSEKSDEKQLL